MSKIEEQSKSANTSEIRYLSPLDIDTAKVKKYCMFRRSGIKYVDYKDPDFLNRFINNFFVYYVPYDKILVHLRPCLFKQ